MHHFVVDSSFWVEVFPHTSCTCRIFLSVSVISSSIGAYWTDFPYVVAVYGVVPLSGFCGGGCWYSFSALATYPFIEILTSPFS